MKKFKKLTTMMKEHFLKALKDPLNCFEVPQRHFLTLTTYFEMLRVERVLIVIDL